MRNMDTENQGGGSGLLIVIVIGIFLAVVIPSVMKMTGSGMGQVGINIPTDQIAMPEPPRCDQDGNCSYEWEAEGELDESGRCNWLRVLLKRDGCPVAENQMVKIQTDDYQQTMPLAEQGYDEAWISQVEVEKSAQGQGLGRSTWKAGDEVIRNVSGERQVIKILTDMVGWGETLMADIEAELIILQEEGLWAYLIG